MLVVTLLPLLLLRQVAIVQADFEFTILFYEFHNPLGLQCSQCSSNAAGHPVCCDDIHRMNNCTNVAPYTCDTRFRFMLRPYGAPIGTAPSRDFPYFTPSNAGNSHTFPMGRPGGFLALPNPYTISHGGPWTVS